MQKEIENSENLIKKNYRRFYFIVGIVTIGALIFISWSLTQGSGENNLGGWLILVIIPSAIKTAAVFILLSLVLKFIFVKFFRNSLSRPILTTVLITVFVTVILGYFFIPALFVQESSYLDFFYIGTIFIGLPAILVTIFTNILRINNPVFWRLNLGPAIITYSLIMFVLPTVIGGLNQIFTKALACDFVRGHSPQLICYRIKAIKTADLNLCIEKNLDQIIKGDCIIGIAVFRKDISFCENPIIKSNNNSYNFCLSEVNKVL